MKEISILALVVSKKQAILFVHSKSSISFLVFAWDDWLSTSLRYHTLLPRFSLRCAGEPSTTHIFIGTNLIRGAMLTSVSTLSLALLRKGFKVHKRNDCASSCRSLVGGAGL